MAEQATYFADDAGRRVVWCFPRGRCFNKEGVEFNFDAEVTDLASRSLTWADAVESAQAWFETRPVAILREHRPAAVTDGVTTGSIVLTKEQALANKIKQPTDEALYCVVDLAADAEREFDRGELLFSSPTFAVNYLDGDEGRRWPLAFKDLSFTNDPRIKAQQPAGTYEARFSDSAHADDSPAPEGTMEEELKALAERIAALEGRVTECEAKMAGPEVEEVVEVEVEPMADAKTASMSDRIAVLETELATERAKRTKAEAEREVDASFSDRNFGAVTRDQLVTMRMRDAESFRVAVSLAPKREARSAGAFATAPQSGISTGSFSDEDLEARANGIAKERNISLKDAWKVIYGGK